MGLSGVWKVIHKYTTFGGETEFTTQFLLWLGSAGTILVALQFPLSNQRLAETPASIVVIGILLISGLGVLWYGIYSAGKYTLERRLRTHLGTLVVALFILGFSGFAVLLIHSVFAILIQAPIIQFTPLEFGLGGMAILGTGIYLSLQSLHHLRSEYPSPEKIRTVFQQETTRTLDNIQTEIPGIGHIKRRETAFVREPLESTENVIVTGDGGVGKSGVLGSVVEDWDSETLFLDASVHSTIEDSAELADQIDLGGDLGRSIRQISIEEPLLVIVDQLDEVDKPTGEAFQEFLLKIAGQDEVAVAFACRTYELEEREEFEQLESSDLFSTKREIGHLDESDAEEHLIELIGSSPSDELIGLARKMEHLDIIAQLADENIDLDDIGGEVSLWEGYRELLEREERPDGTSRGDDVVNRAVLYATRAIENREDGINIFSINPDRTWEDDRLISKDVIAPASDRPGDRKFRFRHPSFLRYLYAWDAVQDNRAIQDVTAQIDERLAKDIFRFMFIRYLQEGGADQIGQIPEGSDASNFAKEFLEEALDNENGLGDYTAKKILDEVKTWDATANDELTNIVLEKLDERETLKTYFFGNPPHPSWAIALRERGKFEDPPDVFLQYLRNLAPEHPDVASEVLPAVETEDRHTLALVVLVIRELPAEYAVNHIELVKESITDGQPDWHSFQTVELMRELVESGESDAAIELLHSLLQPRDPVEGEPGTAQPKADLYNLKSGLEDVIEPLVEAEGERTIDLLEAQLIRAIEIEAAVKNREIDNIPGPLHTSIGHTDFEETSYSNFKNLLTGTLLTALQQWLEADPEEESRERKIEHYLDSTTFLNRIGLYLLNEYREYFRDLVRRELLDEDNYGAPWIKEDFLRLLRDGYPVLDDPEQDRVLEIITNVPVQETLEEGARQRSQEVNGYTAEELAEESINGWVRDRLWVIRDELPEEEREELNRLIDELGEPENVLSVISTRGGFVSQESPLSAEEIEQRSPEQIIEYCIQEPFETTRWEETESGGLQEVSPEGLAETVAQVILDSPSRFHQHIPRLQEASSIYTRELLDGLQEKIENNEQTDIEWTPFLELCDAVVSDPEQWSSPARKSVARLLREAYSDDEHESIYDHNDRVKQILFTLINDPDPDEEREHPPEGHAGYNNPLHVALNSVRPIGVDALLIYAGKTANHTGYEGYSEEGQSGFDLDVRDRVQSIIETASLSVRSTIGRRLHLLWYLDHEIVQENLSNLFPRSQSTRDKNRFAATWDAYVASHPPHEDLFPRFRACYLHGIDLIAADENTAISGANDGLARHLLTAYLRDMEELTAEDSLIAYLYDQDIPDIARQIAWQLWRWGEDNDDIRDEWNKVKQLWEWRLGQVEDEERYANEFQWFVEWLPLVDERIAFDGIVDLLLETTPFINHNRRAWETLESYLAEQAADYPEEAVQIYTRLIEQEERPGWIEFNDTTAKILEEGIAVGGETETQALDIAEDYFSRGDDAAEEFLDNHT
ncbi:hypothetical protein [Haloarcula sp. Atlit-47R]|uniref:hypothetical protein n=1 Tax=Haloarcula sp. Atlit-47R TaxID=2282132 RepID=UPI0018F503E9|nr:hypothetical protein [Haloarcula sp. Atlit-47R]